MTSFNEFKKELLSDPEVRREYEALEPKYERIMEEISKEWLSRVISWFSYLDLRGKLTSEYREMLEELIAERQEMTNKELME